MALIKCPKCEGTVSTKAHACPHCGASPVITEPEVKQAKHLEASPDPSSTMANGGPQAKHPPTLVSQVMESSRSFLYQPLPKWVDTFMIVSLCILMAAMLATYAAIWLSSKDRHDDPNGFSPKLLSREEMLSRTPQSQDDVDTLFELKFPGLRDEIGVVAFDVKRREFRKNYDYDGLPKTSPPSRKGL